MGQNDLNIGGFNIEDIEFPYDIPLKKEIEVDGTKRKKITFREPKGRDYTAHRGTKDVTARNTNWLVDVTEWPAEKLGEMHFMDHAKAIEVADAFFTHYHPMENGLIEHALNSPLFADGLQKIASTQSASEAS